MPWSRGRVQDPGSRGCRYELRLRRHYFHAAWSVEKHPRSSHWSSSVMNLCCKTLNQNGYKIIGFSDNDKMAVISLLILEDSFLSMIARNLCPAYTASFAIYFKSQTQKCRNYVPVMLQTYLWHSWNLMSIIVLIISPYLICSATDMPEELKNLVMIEAAIP